MRSVDVLVVGGGAAGGTAALVLGRARRRVALVDNGTYRNVTVQEFHGFPGRDATAPAAFRRELGAELESYGVERIPASVVTARSCDEGALVGLDDGTIVTARTVVVAVGVADELPPIEGLRERWGTSAFNCPFCDGWEHRDRPVLVIDAAPGADHLAALLRGWTEHVTVVPAGRVRRLVGGASEVGRGAELVDGTFLPAAAFFVKAAVRPRSNVAVELGCAVDEDRYVVTDPTGATSQPHVWAAGDVRRPPPMPHQVVLAAADGSAAAIAIHKALMERDRETPNARG